MLIRCQVVAVWSGLALDGNFISEADLEPYVQSALDEIEFLTGDVHTKWGAVRASLGYPKPWTVKYVEIGNEDWLAGRPTGYDSYKQYRFKRFFDAFQKKYPKIQLIASPSVFDDMVIPVPAAGDMHPYLTPDGFIEAFSKFDHLTKDNLTLIGKAHRVNTCHYESGVERYLTGMQASMLPFILTAGSTGAVTSSRGRGGEELSPRQSSSLARSVTRTGLSGLLM